MAATLNCSGSYDTATDALPADRLHFAVSWFAQQYGDADGAGGLRRLEADEVGDMLHEAKQVAEIATELLRLAVLVARDHGASWQEVGAGLGVSGQAAHQRFARRRR